MTYHSPKYWKEMKAQRKKLQAASASFKLQILKQQATSLKPQAKRFKLQATSFKRQDP